MFMDRGGEKHTFTCTLIQIRGRGKGGKGRENIH